MPKVRFWCNSGANIHSTREEIFDTVIYGYSDEEWTEMSEDEKYAVVEEWAWQRLEIGYTEL